MTSPRNQPVSIETLERFAAYNREHPAWGSLHIVLDDLNVKDHFVESCKGYAITEGDQEGYELAVLLLAMSKGQRMRLSDKVFRMNNRHIFA